MMNVWFKLNNQRSLKQIRGHFCYNPIKANCDHEDDEI